MGLYVSDIVGFKTEYSIYIRDGEIVTGKNYKGDWSIPVDISTIKECIKTFEQGIHPISYCLDFGVNGKIGETCLVEYNDMCNLGNYGVDASIYSEMLVMHWREIVRKQ